MKEIGAGAGSGLDKIWLWLAANCDWLHSGGELAEEASTQGNRSRLTCNPRVFIYFLLLHLICIHLCLDLFFKLDKGCRPEKSTRKLQILSVAPLGCVTLAPRTFAPWTFAPTYFGTFAPTYYKKWKCRIFETSCQPSTLFPFGNKVNEVVDEVLDEDMAKELNKEMVKKLCEDSYLINMMMVMVVALNFRFICWFVRFDFEQHFWCHNNRSCQ